MESIKSRIINNQEVFNITIGDDSITARLLGGGAVTETLFFFRRDRGNLVFCRAKAADRITTDDFFVFSEAQLDRYIESGKVEMW